MTGVQTCALPISEKQENDRIFETESINFIIDSKSIFYFMGIIIDYLETDEGKGFIFKGINNYKTCGCMG